MLRYISFLVFLGLFFSSCKKKYNSEFIGPQGKEEQVVNVIEPFKSSFDTINFGKTGAIPLFFKGRFDKSINWKLTITGDSSGAVKTIIGSSAIIDSALTLWRGEQDSLYYFGKETCTVVLSDYFTKDNSTVFNSIIMNSNVIEPLNKVTLSTKVFVSRPKSLSPITFALFMRKSMPRIGTEEGYFVGYDPEVACYTKDNPSLSQSEVDPSLILSTTNNKKRISWINNIPLEYSKGGLPINRLSRNSVNDTVGAYFNSYFTLKGTDKFNRDYYIGRIERFFDGTLKPANDFLIKNSVLPEDLWFNVFVYGFGDNAKMNYTIKEDDNKDENGENGDGFKTRLDINCDGIIDVGTEDWNGKGDDAFEYPIVLDFKGWKLISVKYSDFTPIKDGKNGNGSGVRNPNKLSSVQFSLVAPSKGGSGHVVFDYPTMTIGGPLKY